MFYVVVEGIEGAGKTTALNVIEKFLNDKTKKETVRVREPGGTPLAEALRDLFKGEWKNEKIDVISELLILYASRNQLLLNVVDVDDNKNKLSDRSFYTAKAYQGIILDKNSKERKLLDFLSDNTIRIFPDLVIYLDISVETSVKRLVARNEPLDRIEKKGNAFFENARKEYDKIFQDQSSKNKYSDMTAIRIDAEQSIEDVEKEIIQKLNEWYDLNNNK